MSEDVTLPLRPSLPPKSGDRIGRYVLTGRVLGAGGFGAVYEATHPEVELRVAIKVSEPHLDAGLRERALREANALARIQHRHVVRVFDAGEATDGRVYLAMELLAGEPLSDLLDRGPVERGRAAAIVKAVGNALDAIHTRGLVHRDVKPGNIFLCRDDDGEVYPKLIDFGIAKDVAAGAPKDLTREGAFIGTPTYSSPEQCNGAADLGPRSDIYALGILAFHLVTGHPPFEGAAFTVAHQHVHAPVPTVGEPALDAVLLSVLAKLPVQRPATAGEAGELLAEAFLTSPPVRSSRRMVGLLAGIALAGAVGVGAVVVVRREADAKLPVDAPAAVAPAVTRAVDAVLADAAIDALISDAASPDAPPPIDAAKKRPPRRNIDDVESLDSN